jgi:hypothetical protein
MPPLVTAPTQDFAIQEEESCERPCAFREDVGDIKDVIRLSPPTHDTPRTISFHAGDFEEGMQAVKLFLVCAFLWYRRSAGQPVFFFGDLSDLGGRT